MPPTIDQRVEMRRIEDLLPHPMNPNLGDLDSIRESMGTNGWYGTVLVQESTGYVIAGWHRSLVAKEFGYEEVPVAVRACDDATALRIMAVDNEANRKGDLDPRKIVDLLTALDAQGSLVGSGFTMDDFADRVALLDAAAGPADLRPAAAPEAGDGESGTGSDYREKFDKNAERRNGQRRLMVLDLPVDRFVWAVEALAVISEEEGLKTNVAAILHLIAERTGTEIPRSDDPLDDEEDGK